MIHYFKYAFFIPVILVTACSVFKPALESQERAPGDAGLQALCGIYVFSDSLNVNNKAVDLWDELTLVKPKKKVAWKEANAVRISMTESGYLMGYLLMDSDTLTKKRLTGMRTERGFRLKTKCRVVGFPCTYYRSKTKYTFLCTSDSIDLIVKSQTDEFLNVFLFTGGKSDRMTLKCNKSDEK